VHRRLWQARSVVSSRVKSRVTGSLRQPSGEVTYFAVINGERLWVSADAGGHAEARLVLVNRSTKHVRQLPEPRAADMTGQTPRRGALVVACQREDVLTAEDVGIWDLAVVLPGKSPAPLRLAERAEVYPTAPVAPAAADDGVVVTPYRTADGRPAVRVALASPSVEVLTLISEPGRLALSLQLNRWRGPLPTSLELDQRGGPGHVSVPILFDDGPAAVSVPLDLVAEQRVAATASVWNVAVASPSGTTRCGRTARDVSDPRKTYRYPTSSYLTADGGLVVFRPYFTTDRHLAVEIDGVEYGAPPS